MPFESTAEVIGGGISENMRNLGHAFSEREAMHRVVHSLREEIRPRRDSHSFAEKLAYVLIGIAEAAKLLGRAKIKKIAFDVVDYFGEALV